MMVVQTGMLKHYSVTILWWLKCVKSIKEGKGMQQNCDRIKRIKNIQ